MQRTPKTLIERHGFQDPDRSTPVHDQIQVWAYNNIETILRSISPNEMNIEITGKVLEWPITVVHDYRGDIHRNVVGFVDLMLHGFRTMDGVRGDQFQIAMEMKGKISSCGDLIRQINFYRKYMNYETVWIVVSPDDRFKRILQDHRIFFVKYSITTDLALF
jgi:hypothetical protein